MLTIKSVLNLTKLPAAAATAAVRFSSSNSNSSLFNKHFLTLKDATPDEIHHLLWSAADLKQRHLANRMRNFQPLAGYSLAMIFEKRSTRTRISTESGFGLLGGQALFLSPQDVHLGVNESLPDTARVLSGFCDIVLARVYSHDSLIALSNNASVPIVNGLSDLYHPLQILADFLTAQEQFGHLAGLTWAFVGDGNNNMTHSFMMGCPKLGMHLRIASPIGYDPDASIVQDARALCKQYSTDLLLTRKPEEAVAGADIVVTDTIVSMGRESEKADRLRDFDGFQVDARLMSMAKPTGTFMHCLPRKQEEVTDEVFYDANRSLVWKEAENRKWTVMAVMLNALRGDYMPQCQRPNM